MHAGQTRVDEEQHGHCRTHEPARNRMRHCDVRGTSRTLGVRKTCLRKRHCMRRLHLRKHVGANHHTHARSRMCLRIARTMAYRTCLLWVIFYLKQCPMVLRCFPSQKQIPPQPGPTLTGTLSEPGYRKASPHMTQSCGLVLLSLLRTRWNHRVTRVRMEEQSLNDKSYERSKDRYRK